MRSRCGSGDDRLKSAYKVVVEAFKLNSRVALGHVYEPHACTGCDIRHCSGRGNWNGRVEMVADSCFPEVVLQIETIRRNVTTRSQHVT